MLDGLLRLCYERFLGARFFLTGPRSRRSWSSSAARSGRDRFDGIPGPEAGVRLPVGHVGTEAALLQDDRLLADGILAELLERRGGGAAPPLLRLGQLGERLLEGDVNISSSVSSERDSLPRFTYGP